MPALRGPRGHQLPEQMREQQGRTDKRCSDVHARPRVNPAFSRHIKSILSATSSIHHRVRTTARGPDALRTTQACDLYRPRRPGTSHAFACRPDAAFQRLSPCQGSSLSPDPMRRVSAAHQTRQRSSTIHLERSQNASVDPVQSDRAAPMGRSRDLDTGW